MSRLASPACQRGHYFVFFNDADTTEIYTLSLHDALPISFHAVRVSQRERARIEVRARQALVEVHRGAGRLGGDRKSTRLNSSHVRISYAVFCLKKKKGSH